MTQISDIFVREVLTINRKATVFECIKKMVERNVGAIVVTDGPSICGIFTERDYLRRIALKDRTSKTTLVEEVMTSRLVCADPNQSPEECMTIMTQQRIRHLPVMEGQQLVGILSIGDLVKRISSDREAQVRYLSDFVSGKYPV
ncbi:MAG: CBS domain-containing protein [Candidatus Aminicenantes bacterium]|jgi:CBS domain-containing protein|nr:CBS domain-containing protein [Candidatus Aminicenantes bacterium]